MDWTVFAEGISFISSIFSGMGTWVLGIALLWFIGTLITRN